MNSDPNPNWPRWIFASVSKVFSATISPTLPFYAEGEDPKNLEKPRYVEFRMNGPVSTRKSGEWRIEVVLNVLVVAKQNRDSIHPIHTDVGTAMNAFKNTINVYRYGSELVDDRSYVGCLQRVEYEGKEVVVNHFGQINPDVRELQAMVQGYYRMVLDT